jgi:S-methylmethionine-dependent homocysteine/selenocysteine methylase
MTGKFDALPQLKERNFLSDGGLETVLIFLEGIDLPCFAAFDLLKSESGTESLRSYYHPFIKTAVEKEMGYILDTPTWRASRDWLLQLGYEESQVADVNTRAVNLVSELKIEFETDTTPMLISGAMGPRGDGYVPGEQMSAEQSCNYHFDQIQALASAGADLVSIITLNYVNEAIGAVRAAQQVGVPIVVGFTTETDGRLPGGESLEDAIGQVDEATNEGPVYYMVNCAHVDHFKDALTVGAEWTRRISAIRANASRLSHAELDECEVLDDGDPQEFGELYAGLHQQFKDLRVFGGCCGTDHRHVAAVSEAIQ